MIDLVTTEETCEIELLDGQKTDIAFRPFTLRDLHWVQTNFSQTDLKLTHDFMAQVVWHMMTPASKTLFGNIKFTEFDEETGQEYEVKKLGHEKLLLSIGSQESMLNAYLVVDNLNKFHHFNDDGKKKQETSSQPTG